MANAMLIISMNVRGSEEIVSLRAALFAAVIPRIQRFCNVRKALQFWLIYDITPLTLA
jgi:hypothetical protein